MRFEVGNICEALANHPKIVGPGGGECWIDVRIEAYGNPQGLALGDISFIKSPLYTISSSAFCGRWIVEERFLRKKRPPNDEACDESFQDIMTSLKSGKPVEAPA